MWCGGGHLHNECTEKGKTASIPTCCNCKLVDGEEPRPSNYRGCRHAEEKMRKRKLKKGSKTTTGRVFSSSHTTPGLPFAAVLRSNSQQQQQPQPPSAAQACPVPLSGRNECRPPLRHNQQVPSQSVQVPNANSSSLNMFTVVAIIFQQILTQLNGAESEVRIMAITKTILKLMKQNGR
jgi:hypothetical protein